MARFFSRLLRIARRVARESHDGYGRLKPAERARLA